jgi:two-component system, cell cycle response regulator
MARKVLLIDDDRIQFRLIQALFTHFRVAQFEIEWSDNYAEGLAKLLTGGFDACLLDYQLGEHDGLQLIREAVAAGSRVPIIFLTAETGDSVDVEAMNAGALDYLVKGEFNARSLERSLRYAVKLSDTMEALRQLATRDELTGLLNRREFERILGDEEERARRFNRPLAVVFLDVDHFKRINDTHGHAAGDLVLREVARRLNSKLRTVDRIARFGGEEFAVMLAEANAEAAHIVAGRLVAAVRETPIDLPGGIQLPVTISAGSAEIEGADVRAVKVLELADKALYAAKAQGRDRAIAAG